MIVEEYKFTWKTFEEEMPKSYECILVRSPRETIRDAHWAFISDDKKTIYTHDLKWDRYVSRCKKWLWCYNTSIELIRK